MLTFITILHVILCVFMIFVILLQPGKDAGMGAAFGGGAATSAFGGRGAVTFLSKLTAACAILFFMTSLGLSFVGLRQSVAATESVLPPAASAPAAKGDGGAVVPPGLEANPGSQPPAESPPDLKGKSVPAEAAEGAKAPLAPPAAPKGKEKK